MNEPYFRRNPNWSEVINPLTDEQVKTWLEALRSGNYEQTDGKLCDEFGYCCLGVLANVMDVLGSLFQNHDGELTKWGNLDDNSPAVYYLPWDIQESLAGLNDSGNDFKYIANVIEAGFFTEFDNEIPDILNKSGFDLDHAEVHSYLGFEKLFELTYGKRFD